MSVSGNCCHTLALKSHLQVPLLLTSSVTLHTRAHSASVLARFLSLLVKQSERFQRVIQEKLAPEYFGKNMVLDAASAFFWIA